MINITPASMMAVMPAVGPTFFSCFRLNSRPSENITRMTPSSDSAVTIAWSATRGMGRCGPMINPATRYPSTTGRCSFCEMMVVAAATLSTIANAERKSCGVITAVS